MTLRVYWNQFTELLTEEKESKLKIDYFILFYKQSYSKFSLDSLSSLRKSFNEIEKDCNLLQNFLMQIKETASKVTVSSDACYLSFFNKLVNLES